MRVSTRSGRVADDPLETLTEHHKVHRKRSIAMSTVLKKQVQDLTSDELQPRESSELTRDELDLVAGGFRPERIRHTPGDSDDLPPSLVTFLNWFKF